MQVNEVHIQIVEMLLASITQARGEDGALSSFFFGKPGAPVWDRRLGIDIYYHFVELDLAALYLRSEGPSYLKALPLDEIRSKLQEFVRENFGHIANTVFLNRNDRPLNEWIPKDEKLELARALATSDLLQPTNQLTVFPLVPVTVENGFVSDQFFFSAPDETDAFFLRDQVPTDQFDTNFFPPSVDFKGRKFRPSAWLGVYSPDYRSALKTRASILGALALTCLARHRHMFSGRHIFGGRCTISPESVTCSFEKTHTPPCMHDIHIADRDTGWMKILSEKLRSPDQKTTRELKALEYFFRAWPLVPEERFPILCMSLDAIFGDANNAGQAIVDGVRETLGDVVPEQQLRMLLKLRASVIHGGAPDVYDSSKYPKYYKKYGCDPIRDLELLVSALLREKVFRGELSEHPDPNANDIEKAQVEGRLPIKLDPVSILNPKQ